MLLQRQLLFDVDERFLLSIKNEITAQICNDKN